MYRYWTKIQPWSTIYDPNEQYFINQLLVEFNNISKYAWIGMQYNGQEYKWIDGTDSNYTNWKEDWFRIFARKHARFCYQMSMINDTLGKWTFNFCESKALIVCQKKPIDRPKVEIKVNIKEIIENSHQRENSNQFI